MAPNLNLPAREKSHLGPVTSVAKKGTGPLGPCPYCGIKGHWKADCLIPPGTRTSPPGPEQESSDPALPRPWDLPPKTEGAQDPRPQLSSPLQSPGQLTVADKPISLHISLHILPCLLILEKLKSLRSLFGRELMVWCLHHCTLSEYPILSILSSLLPKCPTPILGRDLLSQIFLLYSNLSPDLAWLLLLEPTMSSPPHYPSSSVSCIVWKLITPPFPPYSICILLKRLNNVSRSSLNTLFPRYINRGLNPSSLSCCVRISCALLTLLITRLSYLLKSRVNSAWVKTWDINAAVVPIDPKILTR